MKNGSQRGSSNRDEAVSRMTENVRDRVDSQKSPDVHARAGNFPVPLELNDFNVENESLYAPYKGLKLRSSNLNLSPNIEKFHEMSVGGAVILPDGDQSNKSQSNYKYNNLSPDNLLTQNKSITVLEKNDHSSALQLPLVAADARSNVGGSKLDCW